MINLFDRQASKPQDHIIKSFGNRKGISIQGDGILLIVRRVLNCFEVILND